MATVLETQRKKALKGVVRDIQHNCTVSLISAEIEGEDASIETRVPKEELALLDLRIGDSVDIFPIDSDTYLMIGR